MSTAASRQRRGRWRLSIAAFQGLFLGGLVFLTLVGLLVVTLYTAYRNTSELLEDKSRLLLASLTSATSRYLDATLAPVDYVALLMERGELDPDDHRRLYEILSAGLAATPQVHALLFIDARGWMTMVHRAPRDAIIQTLQSWRDDPQIAAAMAKAEARGTTAPFWGPPVYAEGIGTILSLRRPVRGARFLGMVVAALSVAELSEYLASLE
ncbi:MAG: PDC sensor domain-containing protein, partial [Geminicoccales bacterium]